MTSTEKRPLSASAPENDLKRSKNEEEAPAWAEKLFSSMEARITTHVSTVIEEKLAKLDIITERCNNMEENILKNEGDIAELFEQNIQLKAALAEQVDRGLRNNVTVCEIPRAATERSWNDTRKVLADNLAGISSPEKDSAYWVTALERAHRAPGKPREGKTQVIFALFKFYDDVEYVLDLFKKPGVKTFQVYEQFSDDTTERRKKALALRKQLKAADPTIKGYIKYPATLKIRKLDDTRYNTVKIF